MKIVIVEFADSVDTTTLTVNSTVSISKGTTVIAGGTVSMNGIVKNETSVTPNTLMPHTHTFDAPGGVTGQPII
jgi:hypothetical protein